MRATLALISGLLMALPLAAHAQVQSLCDALTTIMPGANSGFKGIKQEKTDKDLWAVAVNLPYAHECEVRKDDKEYSYACYYRVGDGHSAQAEMDNYADNIAACRPDMERSDFKDDTGSLRSLDSAQASINLSYNAHYPTEFTVYIEPAGS